jgi:hypothetical protein
MFDFLGISSSASVSSSFTQENPRRQSRASRRLKLKWSGDIQTGYHKLPKWSLFEIENIEKLNGYHGRMITCVGIFVDSNHWCLGLNLNTRGITRIMSTAIVTTADNRIDCWQRYIFCHRCQTVLHVLVCYWMSRVCYFAANIANMIKYAIETNDCLSLWHRKNYITIMS